MQITQSQIKNTLAVDTKEAKNRVAIAVKDYRSGSMKTVSHEDMWKSIDIECEKRRKD